MNNLFLTVMFGALLIGVDAAAQAPTRTKVDPVVEKAVMQVLNDYMRSIV